MAKQNPLLNKLEERYDDLSDFTRRSGVPISTETVRRLLYEGKPVSAPSLIIIMKYLGFTPQEIKKRLIEDGEKDFSALIGDLKGDTLSVEERALVDAVRSITAKEPDAMGYLADTLDLLARAEGVDAQGDIRKLRRKPRRR